jgi:hypothetical protein
MWLSGTALIGIFVFGIFHASPHADSSAVLATESGPSFNAIIPAVLNPSYRKESVVSSANKIIILKIISDALSGKPNILRRGSEQGRPSAHAVYGRFLERPAERQRGRPFCN